MELAMDQLESQLVLTPPEEIVLNFRFIQNDYL